MRRRSPSSATALSEREIAICQRLREAREMAGMTQVELAAAVGVPRTRISHYEKLNTPLRAGLALKICRQLIVSEEWLATGEHATFWAMHNAPPGSLLDENPFFPRQCLDLWHEVERGRLPIKIKGRFSAVYDASLAQAYAAIAPAFRHMPRLVFSEDDEPRFGGRCAEVILWRWLELLRNEGFRVGAASPSLVWRTFLRNLLLDTGGLLFRRFLGYPTPEVQIDSAYEFLRDLVRDPDAPIGPIAAMLQSVKFQWTNPAGRETIPPAMQKAPKWSALMERLRNLLTEPGSQARFARQIGVSRQALNNWLTGASAASAELTLRLRDEISAAEHEKKGVGSATNTPTPHQNHKKRKSEHHEKSNREKPETP